MMVIRSLLNICILGLIVLNSYFWGLSAPVLLCLFDDAYLWREEREERERERERARTESSERAQVEFSRSLCF